MALGEPWGEEVSVGSVQCPLQEMQPQKCTADLLPKLRAMALADRAVFEKGVRAFVSFVQAYAKHECSLIFRLKGESAAAAAVPVPVRGGCACTGAGTGLLCLQMSGVCRALFSKHLTES